VELVRIHCPVTPLTRPLSQFAINSALELSNRVSCFENETSQGRQRDSFGRSDMRNALWILLLAGLGVFCGWVVIGPWVPRNQGVIFLLIALFAAPNFGAMWMMYTAIRNESRPLPFVALAFVPFSFLWYYAERYRTGRCFAQDSTPPNSRSDKRGYRPCWCWAHLGAVQNVMFVRLDMRWIEAPRIHSEREDGS
jgi:hypothetical protein